MIKFLLKNRNFFRRQCLVISRPGFAMLFTVLIVSLSLSIAIGISSVTLKQTILSSLAKDSQISFYEADAAIECGMYYESLNAFPEGTLPSNINSPLVCGNDSFNIDQSQSTAIYPSNYLVFTESVSDQTKPCSVIVFDKTKFSIDQKSIVQGRGYNVCGPSPRQVERALQVVY